MSTRIILNSIHVLQLSSLERMDYDTMERNRLDSLQVCRAIAALLVVLCHFSVQSKIFLGHELFNSFFNFGRSGVSFFFVLSGFIICYTHWRDMDGTYVDLRKYVGKRLTRILPAYWSVLAVLAMLYVFFGGASHGQHTSITPLAFLKNVFLISYDHEPIVAVAWTLQYEMIFYLFFATFIISSEMGVALLAVWIGLITLFNLNVLTPSASFLKFALSLYSAQFLMGCLVAYAVKKWGDYIPAPRAILLLGVLGFLACGVHEDYFNNLSKMTNATLYAVFSALIISGLVKIESMKPLRFPNLFVFLGGASYSIYLTHNTLISILLRVAQHVGLQQYPIARFTIQTLFVLFTSVAIGCLYYKLYELPVIDYLKRKIKRPAINTDETALQPR